MGFKVQGVSGVDAEVDANTRAIRVTQCPPNIGSNGAYRLCEVTGLLTGVAAGTASAGHIFAARWSNASKLALVTHFRARWFTIAGFTAAQEVGLDLMITRSYTANHSGGTAITLTNNSMKKRSAHGSCNFADMRISQTGALTNGTHTIDTHKIAYGGFSELAAGAAVPKGFFDLQFGEDDPNGYPIVLSQDMGLILRNSILMGAGGTARVAIEMGWLEVDSIPQ